MWCTVGGWETTATNWNRCGSNWVIGDKKGFHFEDNEVSEQAIWRGCGRSVLRDFLGFGQHGLNSMLTLLWARAWTRDLLTSLPNLISLQSYDLCKFHSFSIFEPQHACRLHLWHWITQFVGLSSAPKARRSVHQRVQGRPSAPLLQLQTDSLCLCHILHLCEQKRGHLVQNIWKVRVVL